MLDFNLNENVEVISERPLKEANADNYSVKILRKFFPDLYFNIMAKKGVFVWKSARIYKPLPLLNEKLQKRIVLNGYWQSEKYFSDVAEILRMELTPKKPVQPQNEKLYNKIRNTNSVCVTIRRGDFMNDKNKGTFYICDEMCNHVYKGNCFDNIRLNEFVQNLQYILV